MHESFFAGALGLVKSTSDVFNTLRLLTFNVMSKIAWQYLAA